VRACFKLWSVVAIGFALLAGSLRAEFVYVANGDGNISAYRIGEEGILTPVAGSPFPAGNDPVSIVATPLSKFVYVANSFSNNISAYRIGENGALKPLAGSPFPLGAGSMTVDFLGRFLYVAAGNTVSAYHIGKDGALTAVPGSPFPAGFSAVSVAVDPLG
jgi:6-phosphogluconolactonase